LAATLYEKLERPVKVLQMQKKIKKSKGEWLSATMSYSCHFIMG
jgi:hypothetical protein